MKIYGTRGRGLQVSFSEGFEKDGVLRLSSISIHRPVTQCEVWYAHNDFNCRTKSIYDHRIDPRGYAERPMTDSDVSLCEFAEPSFGDFDDLWRRVETYLQNEGFGSLRDNFEN